MKNRFCKVISVLLFLVVLLPLLPLHSVSAVTEDAYDGEAYRDLKSDALRTAYRLVEEGVAGLSPEISFQRIVEINSADLADVLRAVCVDHPQYFWFLEEGVYYYDPSVTKKIIGPFEPRYILNGKTVKASSQELLDAMHAFHDQVQQIINGIPVNYKTEYEIALYLHDYLAEHVTYTLEGEHPSAYAALVLGEAACYGYSKAYQCLLNAAGIRARTITGNSPDENGQLIGHAWNQVWLDGRCYYMDVTWDDFEEVTLHSCFAMNLETISKDHIADSEFILPPCDHEDLNIFTIKDDDNLIQCNSYTTAEEVAPFFRQDGTYTEQAVFHCEIRFVGGNFFAWFDKQFGGICTMIGLSNQTDAFYYNMHDVYYLTLVDKPITAPVVNSITFCEDTVTLTGAGTQFHLQPQVDTNSVWVPTLVYTSSDESIAKVNENGLITAVSEGTAQIIVCSADGSISASCSVVVNPSASHTHTMRKFDSKKPTCTNDGYDSYYLCTGCGRRFGDADGTLAYTEASAFILPAVHSGLLYISERGYHLQRCKCGEEMPDSKEPHTDADGDGICEICKLSTAGMWQNNPAVSEKKKTTPAWVLPTVISAVVLCGVLCTVIIVRRRRY